MWGLGHTRFRRSLGVDMGRAHAPPAAARRATTTVRPQQRLRLRLRRHAAPPARASAPSRPPKKNRAAFVRWGITGSWRDSRRKTWFRDPLVIFPVSIHAQPQPS
eukprot:gene19565-biopygen22050